jgi:signal transduction histidine kinase
VPVLLAVALLYPPEVAALVGLLGAIDRRELRAEIGFSRAVFNRVQIGLSLYLAGSVFRQVADGLEPWLIAILGTGAALAAQYVANVVLVSFHAGARLRLGVRDTASRLKVGGRGQFLAIYLGYGSLALVLARLFLDVGPWSVVSFLVPTLAARQLLVRGQELQDLTDRLRGRERLLEKLSDQILDERRDERLQVAGDLHDDTLQALTKIWLLAKVMQKQKEKVQSWSEDVNELVSISADSIESLRQIIRDLRESPLGGKGLLLTLQSLVRNARLDWGVRVYLELPDALDIPAPSQVIVYQIAREALINALKHAKASTIWMRLSVHSEQVILEVEDNGKGFEPESVDASAHFGLGLMEERVKKLRGQITILSRPDRGSLVRAAFPLVRPGDRIATEV